MASETEKVETTAPAKKPPRIRVRSRGTYTDTMEAIENAFLSSHPDLGIRWVYAPEDKQDFSKLVRRRGMGYREVKVDEIKENVLLGQSSGSLVRVGDVVLMCIDLETQKEMALELHEIALENARRIRYEYYANVSGVRVGRHTGTPSGDIQIREEVVEAPDLK
jgi:hypothetical protein